MERKRKIINKTKTKKLKNPNFKKELIKKKIDKQKLKHQKWKQRAIESKNQLKEACDIYNHTLSNIQNRIKKTDEFGRSLRI